MVLNKGVLKGGILCLLVGVFLVYRNLNIGVEQSQVLNFGLYYLFGCLVLIFSLIKFKDAINPISIYVMFVFLMSYSYIRLSDMQLPYSISTVLVLNLSVFSYLTFASLDFNPKPFKFLKLNNELKRILLYLICAASFFTFLIEVVSFGYLPVLQIGASDVYIETNAKLVPFLHYFIVLLAFIPAWSYVMFKETVITKKEFISLLIIALFILVNYLSRQLYLLLGITFFMSYSFYNYVNTKILVRGGLLVIALFMFIGFLKFNTETSISFTEFSRAAAGIQNENVSILESTFTEYSSKRFAALDKMIKFKDDNEYLGFGIYTMRPLVSLFLLEKTGVINRLPELDSEKNVGTYAIDPYLDFGLIGVLIINCIYGFLASRYYKQYHEKHPEAIVKFSIIIFCVLMGMFINYYNTMLIWLGLFFNKIIFGGLKKSGERSQ
ncbi:O-antigen polymerase [Pedobacter sp.]|uniref:O-antigen polymerase n=1 Tax=Pedobacter sp. TaxID=1411316 RepID=UPI003D7FDDB8